MPHQLPEAFDRVRDQVVDSQAGVAAQVVVEDGADGTGGRVIRMPSPVPPVMKFCSTALVTGPEPSPPVMTWTPPPAAAGNGVLKQVGDAVRLDQHAGVVVGERVPPRGRLIAGEVLAGEPLEADVRAIDGVAGVGDRRGGAGVRGDAEGALEVQRRVVAGCQVDELVVADSDVAGVGVAVLPDAEDALRVGATGR